MLIVDAINDILGQVPGCPEIEVVSAYRYAAIEFCSRTYAMTAWVSTTVADMKTPALSADEQTIAVLDAVIGDKSIPVLAINSREVLSATADSPVITYQTPNVPVITPWPADETEVQLLLAFAPGPNAVEIADDVWLRYSETLKHGTLSRLLARPNKPYSSPADAQHNQVLFDRQTEGAAIALSRNRGMPAIRLRTRPAPV